MATIAKKRAKKTTRSKQAEKVVFGPRHNGILMTGREFDAAEFEEGWHYELVHGVLIVSPIPDFNEVDPNDELGHLLRSYGETPEGAALSATLPERYVKIGEQRRRPDRVIWAGLGRKPRRNEMPTIVVEFVSHRKRDRIRDYETKRDEYLSVGVQEYWVIDRFAHTLTVFTPGAEGAIEKTYKKDHVYKTKWLPGFQLPLKRLWERAEFWTESDEE